MKRFSTKPHVVGPTICQCSINIIPKILTSLQLCINVLFIPELLHLPHDFTRVPSTFRTIPPAFRFSRKSDTVKMKPLDNTSLIVTADHFTVRNLFTETVCRFIGVNWGIYRGLFFLLFSFSLLFLLWYFVIFILLKQFKKHVRRIACNHNVVTVFGWPYIKILPQSSR